ncbi:DUF58 domain-containing protein [Enterococcus sp. LJL128]
MNVYKLKNSLQLLIVCLIYGLLFLYAAVFNNSTGWIVFFFMTGLVIADFLSLTSTLKNIRMEATGAMNFTVNYSGELQLEMFGYRPILFPLVLLTAGLIPLEKNENYSFPFYSGKPKKLHFVWQPEKRGVFQSLPLLLSSTDFLMLFSKQRELSVEGPFFVLPKQQKAAAEQLLQEILTLQPHFRSPFGDRTFVIRSLRPHHSGDPLGMIDWKQSGKRNELIVKEYETQAEQEPQLLFYGAPSPLFEELLSIYYSFTGLLDKQLTRTQILLADYPAETSSDKLFAVIKPLQTEQPLPRLTNKKLVIFAPEYSEELNAQLEKLQRTNELFLVTFKEGRLCLQWKNEDRFIDTEEVRL